MESVIEILAIIFVLGVPSIALATHLVFRPLLRDIARAIRSEGADPGADSEIERRLTCVEDVCERIEDQVSRLIEVERFHRELEAGRETEPGSRGRGQRPGGRRGG
jgi:hypothetical protein